MCIRDRSGGICASTSDGVESGRRLVECSELHRKKFVTVQRVRLSNRKLLTVCKSGLYHFYLKCVFARVGLCGAWCDELHPE